MPLNSMAPIERVGIDARKHLGLSLAADAGIPEKSISAFDEAPRRGRAGRDRLVDHTGASHSFFDRKASEFAVASAAAWSEVLNSFAS